MKYFIFHKPYRVLSQFSPEGDKIVLSQYGFPKNVYPLGRLDYDSEGLLILTDDKALNHLLLDPKYEHEKTYLVQLEGIMDKKAMDQLRTGTTIRVGGKSVKTRPAKIQKVDPVIPERNPPVRFRKNIPTQWYEIKITEGKNRQVRKMCASVGFPVLRLIRVAIEELRLEGLGEGEKIELSRNSIYSKLGIKA